MRGFVVSFPATIRAFLQPLLSLIQYNEITALQAREDVVNKTLSRLPAEKVAKPKRGGKARQSEHSGKSNRYVESQMPWD